MKRLLLAALILALAAFSVSAVSADTAGTDYSWLDDLTINELKELDTELHKRLPNSGQDKKETDTSRIVGTWETSISGIDYTMVFLADGMYCQLSSDGRVLFGTYMVNQSKVMISTHDTSYLSGNWELVEGQLQNSTISLAAEKTDDRCAFVMIGSSMIDTLQENDAMFFEKRELSELKRFDLVAVNYTDHDNPLFIKRLIGFPGDKVELRDGYLFINDIKYDEPYINDEYRDGAYNTLSPSTIPENRYFVMGDHRNNSNDSRFIGPISDDMILGVVVEINGQPYSPPD